jgi:hypothetical protein
MWKSFFHERRDPFELLVSIDERLWMDARAACPSLRMLPVFELDTPASAADALMRAVLVRISLVSARASALE